MEEDRRKSRHILSKKRANSSSSKDSEEDELTNPKSARKPNYEVGVLWDFSRVKYFEFRPPLITVEVRITMEVMKLAVMTWKKLS